MSRRCDFSQRNHGLYKIIPYFAFLILVFGCSITPAFAASVSTEMFQALQIAFQWIRTLLLIAAAVSIASYGLLFFMGGGSDADKRIVEAKKKLIVTCLACGALSLLPSAIAVGKDMMQGIKWTPGTHIVPPADSSGSYVTVEDLPDDP